MYDTAGLTSEAERLFRAQSFGLNPDDSLAMMIGKLDAQICQCDGLAITSISFQ
ncbi:hypothetical protein [Mesorhizobium escarrei]|uniref:hypothetical protein n=1 Tax=Mesorhizobium escarrei TaxID=666018 RepID=UPI0020A71DD1|nr:hypothetical protein [Mesorhizobium escarrei]